MDPPQAHDDRGDGHEHRTSARSTHQTLLLAQARRSGLPPRRLQDARARDSVAGTAMAEWPGSKPREARLDPSETTGRRWPKDVVDIVRQDLGLRDLPEGDALPETGWVRIFAAVASLLRFANVRGPARTGGIGGWELRRWTGLGIAARHGDRRGGPPAGTSGVRCHRAVAVDRPSRPTRCCQSQATMPRAEFLRTSH